MEPGTSARAVYVMGPSGAGKDTLLAYARARLARAGAVAVDDPRLVVIDNSGALAAAGERLVAAIAAAAVPHPALT